MAEPITTGAAIKGGVQLFRIGQKLFGGSRSDHQDRLNIEASFKFQREFIESGGVEKLGALKRAAEEARKLGRVLTEEFAREFIIEAVKPQPAPQPAPKPKEPPSRDPRRRRPIPRPREPEPRPSEPKPKPKKPIPKRPKPEPKPKPKPQVPPKKPTQPRPKPKPAPKRTPKPPKKPVPKIPRTGQPRVPGGPPGPPKSPIPPEKVLKGILRRILRFPFSDLLHPIEVGKGERFPPGEQPPVGDQEAERFPEFERIEEEEALATERSGVEAEVGPIAPPTPEIPAADFPQPAETPEIDEIIVTAPQPAAPTFPELLAPAAVIGGLASLPFLFGPAQTGAAFQPGGIAPSPPVPSPPVPTPGVPPAPAPGPVPIAPPVAPPAPVPGLPPIDTGPRPPVRLPERPPSGRERCKSVERKRRRRGKCEEGFYREFRGRTEFTPWAMRECRTGKVISRTGKRFRTGATVEDRKNVSGNSENDVSRGGSSERESALRFGFRVCQAAFNSPNCNLIR